MYILESGRAGIQFNAGKTEALSLETMLRAREDCRMSRTPRGLGAEITMVSEDKEKETQFHCFCFFILIKDWNKNKKILNLEDKVIRK